MCRASESPNRSFACYLPTDTMPSHLEQSPKINSLQFQFSFPSNTRQRTNSGLAHHEGLIKQRIIFDNITLKHARVGHVRYAFTGYMRHEVASCTWAFASDLRRSSVSLRRQAPKSQGSTGMLVAAMAARRVAT
jgi:hypothetical protein